MRWFHLERAAKHGQGLANATTAVFSTHSETTQSHSEFHGVMVLIKSKIKDVSVI